MSWRWRNFIWVFVCLKHISLIIENILCRIIFRNNSTKRSPALRYDWWERKQIPLLLYLKTRSLKVFLCQIILHHKQLKYICLKKVDRPKSKLKSSRMETNRTERNKLQRTLNYTFSLCRRRLISVNRKVQNLNPVLLILMRSFDEWQEISFPVCRHVKMYGFCSTLF